MSERTFVTNHALVLAAIARNPEKTAREIGDEVGITERTAHKMIVDLDKGGYIAKTKVGVKNTYRINGDLLAGTLDSAIGELLEMLGWKYRNCKKAASMVKPVKDMTG